MTDVRGKRVFVGLSGGVDSAVSAALLKEAGADVIGVFIKGWYPPGMPCTWSEDRRDAMRVAARLQIPFVTLDASIEYKEGVIDYLLREYGAGRTPNPDVMCNREVKFGAFVRYAREKGADYIATGHYARLENGTLLRGVSPEKDQSYFLWAVPKNALAMTLFPVGAMPKDETRALAKRFDLPNAAKRDSQGICFLGSISVDDFLKAEFSPVPGIAYDTDGNEVGTHSGSILHTLGERVSLEGSRPGPWYVISKDLKENRLTVSHTHETGSSNERIMLQQANWLSDPEPDETLSAQYRYHGPLIQGTLSENRTYFMSRCHLDSAAPGQSLVLYRGDTLVGGAIIG